MTVLDLIAGAMRAIGELPAGQVPSPEEQAQGLALLNAILAHWELQHRKVYIIDNIQFPLEDGKAIYTLGPGGDLDNYRPVKIQSAGVIYTEAGQSVADGLRKKLDIVTSIDWAAINEKRVTGLEPLRLYNDNDYPLLKLYIWPVPHIPG